MIFATNIPILFYGGVNTSSLVKNFCMTTPEAGLGVILGQKPLDLALEDHAIKSYLRLDSQQAPSWPGKGPGKKGKLGHLLRLKEKTETLIHGQQQTGRQIWIRISTAGR